MILNLPIIYGTPNNNSYPGYTNRLGFVDYKQYGNTAYYRPTAQLLLAKYPILSPFRFNIQFWLHIRKFK